MAERRATTAPSLPHPKQRRLAATTPQNSFGILLDASGKSDLRNKHEALNCFGVILFR